MTSGSVPAVVVASKAVRTLDNRTASSSIAAGALAFGVAGLVAPQLVARTYGLPRNPQFRFITRLWGTRTATLGTLFLLADSEKTQRNMLVAATAMNSADAVCALAAGSGVSLRTRLMAAATSAAFAAAGAALLAGLFDQG